MTSRSTITCRSPSLGRSITARKLRPISRWISCVRPDCLPFAASRLPRVWVARGNMPYSAVTQPWALPRRNGGTFSSTLAVHNTRVSPKLTRHEPSAWRVKPGSKLNSRIWSGARPEGRMETPCSWYWCGGVPRPAEGAILDECHDPADRRTHGANARGFWPRRRRLSRARAADWVQGAGWKHQLVAGVDPRRDAGARGAGVADPSAHVRGPDPDGHRAAPVRRRHHAGRRSRRARARGDR